MNKTTEAIINIKNLHKKYYSGIQTLEVLRGIDITIYKEEIVAIVGESGCGKSTLLNVVSGLDAINDGSIVVKGQNIHELNEDELAVFRNQYVGFVFQFHYLLPDFTALENVMLPYLTKRFNKKEARHLALNLLKEVNLENRLDHRPNQLSGGEQQRVAIARALINKPSIIFADEPTGNLDEKNSLEVQKLLWNLRDNHNLTILLVTHNEVIANKADRKIKLAYGKIENN